MNTDIFKIITEKFISEYNNLDSSADADTIRKSVENFIKKYNNILEDEVIEHTANMWKYLPVPENQPEPFPEYKTINLTLPEFNIIGSRVRGKKHKHEGTNCDDWFEVANYGKIACIAVSDGAGSKKFSRIGAKISCMSAVSSMKKSLEKLFTEEKDILKKISLPVSNPDFLESCKIFAKIVQDSVLNAIDSVETAFKSRSEMKEYSDFLGRELKLNDFSSTLLVSLVIPCENDSDEVLFISCQIGDGISAIINKDNSIKLMGVADSGDYSGETDFLTSVNMKNPDNLQLRTKISKSPAKLFLMMTDGVADDYFPNETEMLRLCSDLVLNGIIPDFFEKSDSDDFSGKIPEPIGYPNVNDKTENIFLRYSNRICSALNISLSQLCRSKSVFADSQKKSDEALEELLRIWLDNYVERGSFDDRTLVVVNFSGE